MPRLPQRMRRRAAGVGVSCGMPQMTYRLEDRPLVAYTLTTDRPRLGSLGPTLARIPLRGPDEPGRWKYRSAQRSRWVVVLAALASVGLHAFALLGFNQRVPPPVRVKVADEPVILMTMPDLKEEEIEPVDALGEEAAEAPSVAVPMLADVPTIVPIDAFVQPLDFTPALPANLDSVRLAVIPVNPARNNGALEKLGKIFDVSQLDRQPHPLFQPAPVFPPDMKKEFPESVVVVEFIINTKGEVLMPRVLSAQNRRFEEAAAAGVLKWKFRPGYKVGRPVNTRTRITITFRVTSDN
jgi:periplasmic protein TonB